MTEYLRWDLDGDSWLGLLCINNCRNNSSCWLLLLQQHRLLGQGGLLLWLWLCGRLPLRLLRLLAGPQLILLLPLLLTLLVLQLPPGKIKGKVS